MANNPSEYMALLDSIDQQLDNPVTQEDLLLLRRTRETLDKLDTVINRFQRAGMNVTELKSSVDNNKQRVDKFIREFS